MSTPPNPTSPATSQTDNSAKRTRNLRLPPEKRIADIIAAARKILAKKGYESALMSEIAEEAGIVEGTIYRHFENKRDLFIKVAENWVEKIISHNKSIARVDGTLNQLRNAIWQVLTIIHKEPSLTRFVLMELRPNPDYRSTRVYQLTKQYTENVIKIVKAGMDSGELDDSYELKLVRDMVFGCIEHHTWSYLNQQQDFSIDHMAEKIANITYQGLLKTPPPREDTLEDCIHRLEVLTGKLKNKER